MSDEKTTATKSSKAPVTKVTGGAKPIDLDVKRFHVPGVKLIGKCPACGVKFTQDFTEDYLSYPTANKAFKHGCYCQECQHEWDVSLTLTLSLTATDTIRPKGKR